MGIKPEAASPSTVYRVLAVRRGGGIWVGLQARQAGGLLCCLSSTFLAREGTGGVRVRVPLIFAIGRVFRYRVS